MKVQPLGHAGLRLTPEVGGPPTIPAPYKPGAFGLDYAPIATEADVVAVTHEHADHNDVGGVKGKPQVVRGAGAHEAKGIRVKGVATYHDPTKGSQRGEN